MFYSETLLSKTGPLARVWLSANIERKLSKNHILQASVKDSVHAIVQKEGDAPMALRLSGQLLLGVVRIYSRKARYLLDDCNEALIKIKMAFRISGSNDMPTSVHAPSRDALMLPDVLTEGDNLEMPPLPDASFLFSQIDDDAQLGRKGSSRDINLSEDFQSSQFLQSSIDNRNSVAEDVLAIEGDDLDLELDYGSDLDEPTKDVEIGRDAATPRPVQDDIFSELDMRIPAKDNLADDREESLQLDFGRGDSVIRTIDDDGDHDMGGLPIGEGPDFSALPTMDRARISESPLSDIDETVAQEVEAEHFKNLNLSGLYEPQDETEQSVFRNPAQRARKQKLLQADDQTTLSNTQIKAQQTNRDKIIQAPSFLPRDPELLALLEMQKNGGFVSNIMGEGRSMGWAPELRGMLSLAAVRKTGELKRKRDSGIADMDSDAGENSNKAPRLELGEDDTALDVALGTGGLGADDTVLQPEGTILEMAGDEALVIPMDDDENIGETSVQSPGPNFDETTAPLVHPQDSGPVSLGTKHAVHLLRDRFGAEAADDAEKRKQASVLFQDLLPEDRTSRVDATKMFFEILVLATKDAIKIEQTEGQLGGPIRVRGKRGLWGAWAEREAGGEIEEEAGEEVATQGSAPVAIAV